MAKVQSGFSSAKDCTCHMSSNGKMTISILVCKGLHVPDVLHWLSCNVNSLLQRFACAKCVLLAERQSELSIAKYSTVHIGSIDPVVIDNYEF